MGLSGKGWLGIYQCLVRLLCEILINLGGPTEFWFLLPLQTGLKVLMNSHSPAVFVQLPDEGKNDMVSSIYLGYFFSLFEEKSCPEMIQQLKKIKNDALICFKILLFGSCILISAFIPLITTDLFRDCHQLVHCSL